MGFLRPKIKTPEPAPPPTVEDTEGAKQDYADMLRRRRGRAAAILTTRQLDAPPPTAAKVLLGS